MTEVNRGPSEGSKLISAYLSILEEVFDNQDRSLELTLKAEKEHLRQQGRLPAPLVLRPRSEWQEPIASSEPNSQAEKLSPDDKLAPFLTGEEVGAIVQIVRSSRIAAEPSQSCGAP